MLIDDEEKRAIIAGLSAIKQMCMECHCQRQCPYFVEREDKCLFELDMNPSDWKVGTGTGVWRAVI